MRMQKQKCRNPFELLAGVKLPQTSMENRSMCLLVTPHLLYTLHLLHSLVLLNIECTIWPKVSLLSGEEWSIDPTRAEAFKANMLPWETANKFAPNSKFLIKTQSVTVCPLWLWCGVIFLGWIKLWEWVNHQCGSVVVSHLHSCYSVCKFVSFMCFSFAAFKWCIFKGFKLVIVGWDSGSGSMWLGGVAFTLLRLFSLLLVPAHSAQPPVGQTSGQEGWFCVSLLVHRAEEVSNSIHAFMSHQFKLWVVFFHISVQ